MGGGTPPVHHCTVGEQWVVGSGLPPCRRCTRLTVSFREQFQGHPFCIFSCVRHPGLCHLVTAPSAHHTTPHHTSPHVTPPHPTPPHPTSPHLTSPHLTSPHLTSPHLTSPHLSALHRTAPTSPNLTTVTKVIGGANPERQKKTLRANKPLVVVGTPGRLAAMQREGAVRLHQVRMVALDEADALADKTYKRDLAQLMEHMGKKVEGGPQFLLTSASLTEKSLEDMQRRWGLPEMCQVTVGPSESFADTKQDVTMSPTLTHFHVQADGRHKVCADGRCGPHRLRNTIWCENRKLNNTPPPPLRVMCVAVFWEEGYSWGSWVLRAGVGVFGKGLN